ncbi:MAG: LamG domain-containing protein, partial [Planctomycetes bacterium]|nr:LamG domain-containing protein [Planctomycetota bacterium]
MFKWQKGKGLGWLIMILEISCLLNLNVHGEETLSEFTPDDNTIFLAHYNTSTTADIASGTTAPIATTDCSIVEGDGYIGGGLSIGKVAKAVTYKGDDGNFNSNAGTIEFWFKPNWSSTLDSSNATDDMRCHAFFTYGNDIHLSSGTGDNNSFIMGTDDYWNTFVIRGRDNNGEEFQAGSDKLAFREGKWYNIVMEYENFNSGTNNASIRLYKNGTVVAEITDKKISFGTHPTMYISGLWGSYVANGIIDELRIS